jgi:hypothetical protein
MASDICFFKKNNARRKRKETQQAPRSAWLVAGPKPGLAWPVILTLSILGVLAEEGNKVSRIQWGLWPPGGSCLLVWGPYHQRTGTRSAYLNATHWIQDRIR